MSKSLFEIIDETNKIKDLQARINFLHAHNSNALQTILKIGFDSTIESLLPEGAPPYTPCEKLEAQGMLATPRTLRQLRIFFKNNGYDHLSASKRENIFIGILEGLDPKDAELLIAAKDKKFAFRFVNRAFIIKCFPTLLDDVTDRERKEYLGADVQSA